MSHKRLAVPVPGLPLNVAGLVPDAALMTVEWEETLSWDEIESAVRVQCNKQSSKLVGSKEQNRATIVSTFVGSAGVRRQHSVSATDQATILHDHR